MGLGKTAITLTAIDLLLNDYFEVRKVIVVALLRVASTTWPDEIKKWDHLSNLRNSWEFRCLDMGERLGRFIGQYRLKYFTPGHRNGNIVYSYNLFPGAEDEIYNAISDITVSVKAANYLQMPELISTEYPVYLSEKELEHYDELKKDLGFQLPEGEVTAANAATLSSKLSQMANGAVYSGGREPVHIHDHKLDALEDIIEAANGKPVLVAYWFKHDLARITERSPA